MGQSSSPGSEIKNVNFKKKDKKDIIKKRKPVIPSMLLKFCFLYFLKKKLLKSKKMVIFY